MEVRYLKLIQAIVEEGSLTKASKMLHLTQSALSHQLKEVETQLDTGLFYRINNRLVLTEAGKKVYQTAKEIVGKLGVLEKEISELNHGVSGQIRICTECYTSYYWLPPVLKKFKKKFPKVQVTIKVEGTQNAIDLLLDGDLDIVFMNNNQNHKPIKYQTLFRDEMLAVVSANHGWANKEFVSAEDFQSENLIIHSKPLSSVTVYEKILKPNHVEPKEITVIPLTEAAIELSKAEMGVSVLPSWTLKPYLDSSLRAIRVTKNGLNRTHNAAYLDQKQPPFLSHFIELIKQELQL